MKYFLSFLSLFITSFVSAQTAEARTEVRVLVKDFLQISNFSPVGQMVQLELAGETDFEKGTTKISRDNLLITTTVDYSLMARAALPYFTSLHGKRSFPSSILTLEVENTDFTATAATIMKINNLVTTNQPLLTKGRPVFKNYLNIRYSISAEQAREVLDKAGAGLYTNTVIYTLTSQ